MPSASDELWEDLAAADAMGDEELARVIADRIREIEDRGVGDYASQVGRQALEIVGSGTATGAQIGAYGMNRAAELIPGLEGAATEATRVADRITQGVEQERARRLAEIEGDPLAEGLDIATDVASYINPLGRAGGASQAPGRVARTLHCLLYTSPSPRD